MPAGRRCHLACVRALIPCLPTFVPTPSRRLPCWLQHPCQKVLSGADGGRHGGAAFCQGCGWRGAWFWGRRGVCGAPQDQAAEARRQGKCRSRGLGAWLLAAAAGLAGGGRGSGRGGSRARSFARWYPGWSNSAFLAPAASTHRAPPPPTHTHTPPPPPHCRHPPARRTTRATGSCGRSTSSGRAATPTSSQTRNTRGASARTASELLCLASSVCFKLLLRSSPLLPRSCLLRVL